MTDEEFEIGFALLGSAFPDYVCTPQTVAVYRIALRDSMTAADFEKAVWDHIRPKKWFPKISELLGSALDQMLRCLQSGRPGSG